MDRDDVRAFQGAARVPGPEQEAVIARMVFNALDHGVLVQGPMGRIAAANPAAAEILGIERDDLVGSRLEQIRDSLIRADGSPFDPDELPGRLAVLSGKPQLDVLMGLPLVGGEARWIEVSSRPLRSEGEVFAVVSALRDVTERRRPEDALRDAERRQRLVLEHAVGGYAILGDDGQLVDGSTSLYAGGTGGRRPTVRRSASTPAPRRPGRGLAPGRGGQAPRPESPSGPSCG